MYNYVNGEAFFRWYENATGRPADQKAILDQVFRQYAETRRSVFEIPADKTVSGRAEQSSMNILWKI